MLCTVYYQAGIEEEPQDMYVGRDVCGVRGCVVRRARPPGGVQCGRVEGSGRGSPVRRVIVCHGSDTLNVVLI